MRVYKQSIAIRVKEVCRPKRPYLTGKSGYGSFWRRQRQDPPNYDYRPWIAVACAGRKHTQNPFTHRDDETSGDNRYNHLLSLRRAAEVQRYIDTQMRASNQTGDEIR